MQHGGPPVRGVYYEDLEFARRPVLWFSLCGTPYLRWLRCGVPRLPAKVLNCVFYLYRDRASAERGDHFGGTGFLVAMRAPDPGKFFTYGVTNWHVAVKDGFSVIRLNTRDGHTAIFEFGPEEWRFIPQGDDVAISPALPVQDHHKFAVVFREMFNADENRKDWKSSQRGNYIGLGDDVAMIGRFIDHDGGETNMPAARFGNISVMPTPIEQPNGEVRDTFLVDMHSRTGYSGSPVFVYRTPGNDLEMDVRPMRGTPQQEMQRWFNSGFFMLLGIHYGQFPEEWKIEGKPVTGLSGMTCVVPAQSIIDLLDLDEIKMDREKTDVAYRPTVKPLQEAAEEKPNAAAKRDEMLRTMLSTPHQPRKKAVPKKVSSK